jgi:conjugal transfer ATP-binding protein TraC
MPLNTSALERLFDQGVALSDLLTYIDIDDELVCLSDGSLGVIWKLHPININGMGTEQIEKIAASIEQVCFGYESEDIALQLIFQIKPGSKELFSDYLQESNDSLNISAHKITHLLPLLREQQLFLTLRFFPQYHKQSFIKVSAESLQKDYGYFQDHMRLLTKKWQASLEDMGLVPNLLRGDDLVQVLNGFMNPKNNQKALWANDGYELLRDKLIHDQPVVDHYGMHLNDLQMRLISVKELPMQTMLGMLSLEHHRGGEYCLLDGHQYLTIVINFNIIPTKKAMDYLNLQKSFSFLHRQNWLGDHSVEANSKSKEINATLEDVYAKGKKIVLMRVHIITMHEDPDQLQVQANKVITDLGRLSMEGIIEDIIGSSLFLTTLPLNFDPLFDRFIKRQKRLLSSNASDLMLLLGDYIGTKTPASVYLNRRGGLVSLDMFDSSTNPHALVVGASGSGKSFLMNDFILQHQRVDAHFFVIDKGDSYYKTSQFLSGQYIKFDLNQPLCINPFDVEFNAQNSSFLLSLLSQMASGLDPRDKLTRQEEGLLSKALHELFQQSDRQHTLSDLIAILNSNEFNDKHGVNSLMGPTLALRLTPFSTKGNYGCFFDGISTITLDKKFIVFELAQLSSYPELQVVVLMNLMFYLTNLVMTDSLKPKRKYILIDEAWSLLNIKSSAEFITNAFKTFRKYRCSVMAITQELADLTNQQTGLAILANTAFKIFLKQDPAVIDAIKDQLSLTGAWVDLLKSVHIKKGVYAECCVMHEQSGGIIRLYPDNLLYAIANSEASFQQYLSKLMAEHQINLPQAIILASKERRT